MIGTKILHYEILDKLGQGGMGVVHKALDTKLRREVAIKFLPGHIAASSDERERFEIEARAAAALNHPNIATIHAIEEMPAEGDQPGELFIVMEYIEGREIKELISASPLKIDDTIHIAMQIAEGLQAAHDKEIVHRDIKSANIMVIPDRKNQVKIMDFGLAKLAGEVKLTKTSTTLGTIAYMSPEQAQGNPVDNRSDLFSFGTLIYEMLTGQHPFQGDYEQAVVYSILNEEPQPVTALRTGVPLELERIVNKAMAKSPEERYQHADDMLVDLKACQRDSSHTGTLKSAPVIQPQTPGPGGRQKPLVWIAGLGVIAVLALLFFILKPFSAAESADRRAIAVLPFEDMNKDPENAYFSSGITEDIITQLSKIGALRVISRSSSMKYKDSDLSLREIGKALGVGSILEGSIRRSGDQVRIVSQLIDSHSDEHIWAESYDREIKDIFALQSEVARSIAAALEATLTSSEAAQIDKKPTDNLSAYDYYLKGREYYRNYRKQDNENAISLFKNAIALDATFAQAYAGLGDAYAQRPWRFGFTHDWLDSAIAVSQKALAIDANSAEGYKALALAYEYKGWYSKSLEANHKAIALNPNNDAAIGNVGWNYWFLGDLPNAVHWMEKSLLLDPTSAMSYFGLGLVHLPLEMYDQASTYLDRALELQPDMDFAHWALSQMAISQGQYDEAISRIQKLLAIDPDGSISQSAACEALSMAGDFVRALPHCEKMPDTFHFALTGKALVYEKVGQPDKAARYLELLESRVNEDLSAGNESADVRLAMAMGRALAGDQEGAYEWLDKAHAGGMRWYTYLAREPAFEKMREQDRFQELLAKMTGQVAEMRRQLETSQ